MQRSVNGVRSSSSKFIVASAVAAVGLTVASAPAADITRTSTNVNINSTTAWDGGVVPGPDDVAVWSTLSRTGNQTLGADLSFGGVRILNPAALVNFTGVNVLTLGASGIDMSNATADLTIVSSGAGGGVQLGAAQTWNVAANRTLTVGNSGGFISNTGTLTKSGEGTLLMSGANSNFTGGLILNAGRLATSVNTSTTSGVLSNGPFGVGTVTVNGGAITVSGTSGRDISNDFKINGDFTVGLAGAAGANGTPRVRFAGSFDLSGGTRTVTLANAAANLANGSEQFAFYSQGGRNATVTNGTIRFVASSAATAAAPSVISVSASGGAVFTNNSGLTLGNNVVLVQNNGQGQTGTNSPKVTLETGSVLLLGNSSETRTFVASSLSGTGTVAGYTNSATVTTANITVDAASGTTSFGGTIQDNYTVFGSSGTGATVGLVKNGAGTQVLTGVNTYTGATSVNGGTLQLGNGTAGNDGSIASTSGVTVADGATLAYNRAGSSTAGYAIGGSGGVLKTGAGTQTLSGANTYTGTTIVAGGTLAVGTAAATPLLAGSGTTGGTDIQNGSVSFTGGDAAAIRGLLAAGYADATTPGVMDSGTLCSSTATAVRGLGYKDTGSAVLVKAALFGDADLDGGVSINDFNTLAGNFGAATGKVWVDGDFDYDGGVSINDFNLLAGGFGQSLPAGSDAWAGLLAFAAAHNDLAAFEAVTGVPEPSTLGVVAAGVTLGLRRRRGR